MRILFFSLVLCIVQLNVIMAFEPSADLFTYDENEISEKFKQLDELEAIVMAHPGLDVIGIAKLYPLIKTDNNLLTPYSLTDIQTPGKFPSFWFTFIFSAVGTYTIYGVVAGPIATGIVYFASDRDKTETKKAIWGCVTGTLIGAGIKYVVVNL